jgi:hypothetical protein
MMLSFSMWKERQFILTVIKRQEYIGYFIKLHMNKELYNKLFSRMEELNAIRKDLSFGCEVSWYPTSHESTIPYIIRIDWTRYYENGALNQFQDEILYNAEIIWHPPILSDCIYALKVNSRQTWIDLILRMYDYSKPYLRDQKDHFGEQLLNNLQELT